MSPAAQINKYLAAKGSPLAGKGAVFVREARKNGLDPFLLVAIAGAESDFGKYGPTAKIHNPFGWGPHIKFRSWEQAISTVARGLRKGYLDEGRKTISAIGAKWAPQGAANDPTNLNSNWARNVGRFYAELGGQGISAKPAKAIQGASPALPAAQPAPALSAPDFSGLALQNVSAIAGGGKPPSPLEMLSGLTSAVASQPPPDLTVSIPSIPNFGGLAPQSAQPAQPALSLKGWKPGAPIIGGSRGAEHGTSGLPGYTGVDWFNKPGSAAVAPVSGTVIKLSGHDPSKGAVQGAGGPLGWSVYIRAADGSIHYLTHLGSRNVKVGQQVRGGQQIGTVADYDRYGRPSHVHYGVKRGHGR